MMKLVTIIITFFIGYVQTYAQTAKWVIPMVYEQLEVCEEEQRIIGKVDSTTYIFDTNGEIKAKDSNNLIHAYREGIAVATKPNTDQIVAIYKEDGKSYPIANLSVTYDMPFFYDGFLLTKADDFFYFVNRGGMVSLNRYSMAYPYSHGYAACMAFNNSAKMKDPYYTYLDNEGNEVPLIIKGKIIDKQDITFVSSINDELQGFLVAKGDVYIFDAKNRELKPLYGKTVEKGKQRQAEVKEPFISLVNDTTYCLTAKTKVDDIYIFFDHLMTPTYIINGNDTTCFRRSVMEQKIIMSNLNIIGKDNGEYKGLNYIGEEFLPPQFSDIIILEGDKAMVRKNDKWGVMGVNPDFDLIIQLNEGKEIGFRHRDFKTTIRVDLPQDISAKRTMLKEAENCGIDIDKKTGIPTDTDGGNYLVYICKLDIPDGISADTITTIVYPIQVFYDNFCSPVIPVTANVWHLKYLNATVDQEKSIFDQGNYTFYIEVIADRIADEGDYRFELTLETDSLNYELEKLTEKYYKCKITELAEGTNNINVKIQEIGCPPTIIPFEVTYQKPTLKENTPPKQQVVIKKIYVAPKPKPIKPAPKPAAPKPKIKY